MRGFFVGCLLFGASATWAYPAFIGYGYTSCQICHFNAFGNGPLTDYGRALGANTIAARGPFAGSRSDDDLSNASGFLGSTTLPDWVRPAADFRGLMMLSDLELQQKQRRFIPMQADLAITMQSSSRDHWATVSVGYLPDRGAVDASKKKRLPWISREHYLSYKVGEQTRLLAGMMDIPYGLRIPDHTAYSRSSTFMTQNDQAHLLALHHYGDSYEVGLSAIGGNFFQAADLRQAGGALMVEYDLSEKVRVGHSSLYTRNKYRSRLMNALHARVGAGEGSAILVELGMVSHKTQIPSQELRSYLMFENMIRFSRGVHLLILGEYSSADTFKSAPRSFRFGPALQYFIMNRVEWRTDFQITRTLNASTVEKDAMDLLTQLHFWF